ncbi:MAG TPA: phosphoglucosamine mutase [Pyrinomonadaceae bacterium]|nr:phosphoglucosamine mutase [Pyrinomonadaceae bacterium]
MVKKLFGTDGIRGVAGEFPLDQVTVMQIGRSLAGHMGAECSPKFVIARDTRESGEWIEGAFVRGAASAGAQCLSAGVMTTPGLAFLTGEYGFDAGVVISASHNPFQDNGLKVFLPSGKKLGRDAETLIENDIAVGGRLEPGDLTPDASRAGEFQKVYVRHLETKVPDLDLKGYRIVVDCANGAASALAPPLFEFFGADVTAINNAPNGRNINLDSGSLHLNHLQAKVREIGADFGVAFDGDADRALFVDEKGDIVDGDATLWIMARHLERNGKLKNRTIVSTVMSNIGLELALSSVGVKMVRTSVGDKYVLDELLASGSELGGEQSGHIIFPSESLVGDGMLTAVFVLNAIRTGGCSLSEAVEGFVRYPQVLLNVRVREKLPFESVPEISAASKAIENEIEGTGRLLLRYSGTENLARVMIEGKHQAVIDEQAKRLAAVIENALG